MAVENIGVNFGANKDVNVQVNMGGEGIKTEISFPTGGSASLEGVAQEKTLTDGIDDILTEVSKVSDAQAMIDELLAIQLETIIGKPKTDENT